jgi:hypothetical protein
MITLTIPRPAVDSKVLRERELTVQLQRLDAELEQLESDIADFKRTNFFFSNGNFYLVGDSLTVRAAVDCRARVLASHLDRIRIARDAVLHELAYL